MAKPKRKNHQGPSRPKREERLDEGPGLRMNVITKQRPPPLSRDETERKEETTLKGKGRPHENTWKTRKNVSRMEEGSDHRLTHPARHGDEPRNRRNIKQNSRKLKPGMKTDTKLEEEKPE